MSGIFPGPSPVRMGGCTCHRSTISLDLFERVFVRAALEYHVEETVDIR